MDFEKFQLYSVKEPLLYSKNERFFRKIFIGSGTRHHVELNSGTSKSKIVQASQRNSISSYFQIKIKEMHP